MKLTLSWLREFIDVPDLAPSEIVEAFEGLGHEVEEWRILEPEFVGVVVARVLDVRPHPNADKVRLTTVDVGGESLEIICGAWNFEAGALVPVAVPGAVLGSDFEITRREIRGIASNGMICSEVELALGDESDGIMVLGEDYPSSAEMVGEPFETLIGLPDIWFEIDVTPNRPDCMSVYGLARDLAALWELPLRETNISVVESGEPSSVEVAIQVPDLNPRFSGREVRGISVGPSPHWLRWRLAQAGVRPISNVVDASNYAMIEFGYPTHAFDVDRLGHRIVTRMATEGETIVTLDEQVRTLTVDDIVVTDGMAPVAIGGVMGGASTEVHSGTVDVFVEAAYWNPAHVLMTSKRLNLRSEASARFERGADPSFCPSGADRVAQLLEQIAGGTSAPRPVDINPGDIRPWTIEYPLRDTPRTLGIELDSTQTSSLLERLTFDVTGVDPLLVEVPTRRPDVRNPIDLVEEIARLHGFDKIPDTVPRGPGGGLGFQEKRTRLIRNIMVGAGFHETMTFSFIASDATENMSNLDGSPMQPGIRILNPINESEGVMRTTLIPGLLTSASTNTARSISHTRIFETGRVFLASSSELPDQPSCLGFLIAGGEPATWSDPATTPDLFDGIGVWELLADRLDIDDVTLRPTSRAPFHPGRCAEIVIAGSVVGVVGEILPKVAESYGLTGRVIAAELDLAELLLDAGQWQFEAPSTYPPIIFDLSFAVDTDTAAASIVAAARAGAGEHLETIKVFDVFTGESLGTDKKSVGLAFRFRAADRTLSEEDAAPIRELIVAEVESQTGGVLRGSL